MFPSFSFGKDDGLFLIGSCFASNMERYFAAQGYTINSTPPRGSVQPGLGWLNKYTPASIHQEIAWARQILDRDDRFRSEDCDICFFDCEDGKVIDLQLHAMQPTLRADAVARRALVYEIYRKLFVSRVVVITLGLIEAWWDTVTSRYIVETPSRWLLSARDRFEFETLDFAQCLAFTEQSIDLVMRERHRPNILITTSPVVLSRTFTDQDIIIANQHSKATLRAVAGEIASRYENVDYFPSYESVILTRRNEVWRDDLTHVSESFVQRIMHRVEEKYSSDQTRRKTLQSADVDLRRQVVSAIEAHEFDRAGAAYAQMLAPLAARDMPFHIMAAVLAARRREPELARKHLDASEPGPGEQLRYKFSPLRIAVASWLGGEEEKQREVERLRKWGVGGHGRAVIHAARWLDVEGEGPLAGDIVGLLDPDTLATKRTPLGQLAAILKRAGRDRLATRLTGSGPAEPGARKRFRLF